MATPSEIVTGETQIEARSLQQAFAEANAGLRQANTLIGEYSIVEEEDDEDAGLKTAVNGNGHLYAEQNRPLPSISRPVTGNGLPSNGRTHQPSLFSNGQVKGNGATAETHLNGQASNKHEVSRPTHSVEKDTSTPPPVPRPRLVLNQLPD